MSCVRTEEISDEYKETFLMVRVVKFNRVATQENNSVLA